VLGMIIGAFVTMEGLPQDWIQSCHQSELKAEVVSSCSDLILSSNGCLEFDFCENSMSYHKDEDRNTGVGERLDFTADLSSLKFSLPPPQASFLEKMKGQETVVLESCST